MGSPLNHKVLVRACVASMAANDGALYADDVATRCNSNVAAVRRNVKLLVAAGLRLPEFTPRRAEARENTVDSVKVASYNIQFWDGDKWRIGQVIRTMSRGKHRGWLVVKVGTKKIELDPSRRDRRGMPLYKEI